MKSNYVPKVLGRNEWHKVVFYDDSDCSLLYVCDSCSSALDEAWKIYKNNTLLPWDSVLAFEQTEGRGQLRREWISPRGNIYAALSLPEYLHGAGASVYIGWLMVKALREVLKQSVTHLDLSNLKLKWPNDIVLNNHKVGGILLEEKGNTLIAGIGLNFSSAPEKEMMRENFVFPAGCLQGLLENNDFLNNFSAQTLWLSLVTMMRFWYETKVPFTGGGIPHYLVEQELAFLREMVRICDFSDSSGDPDEQNNDSDRTGRILGLGPNAELKLETSGGEILLSSGSIYPMSR